MRQRKVNAHVVVARDASGAIERKYLAAAGATTSVGAHENVDARFDDLDPAARDVALGAHAAVVHLKKLLA